MTFVFEILIDLLSFVVDATAATFFLLLVWLLGSGSVTFVGSLMDFFYMALRPNLPPSVVLTFLKGITRFEVSHFFSAFYGADWEDFVDYVLIKSFLMMEVSASGSAGASITASYSINLLL